jgi:alkanesulfonate monooxygenase SsuD/methylene tetrahydromethanopterin reductase-like flavin-dependent oxidoreductase (luciferase family)
MKFGLHYLLSCSDDQSVVRRYEDTIEQAVYAEDLGFESVWPVEQHLGRQASALPCPAILLAAIAARTSKIRLGTGIVQLPLHHPLRVAEEMATLDVLSKGRVEFGVGRGSNPEHFKGFGLDIAENRARFAEFVDYIRLAWENEGFSFSGRFASAHNLRLSPSPLQREQLPLHVAANSAETIEWAGQRGLPVIVASHVNPMPRLEELLGLYRKARREGGHGRAAPGDVSLLMPLFVGRGDLERALAPSIANYVRLVTETLAPALERAPDGPDKARLLGIVAQMRNTNFARVNDGMGIFDDPERCVSRLRMLRNRLGFGRLIGWFNFGGMIPHHQVVRSMELFASDVMPFFSAEASPSALRRTEEDAAPSSPGEEAEALSA